MATIHRYVDNTVGVSGDGTIGSPWKLLGNILWTVGVNNVKDDIDAGNNVIIHLKGGCTFAGTFNLNYGGTSDGVRVTVDGDYATYPGGVGTNAIIDNWTTVAGAGFAGPDENGVYNIAWAVPAASQVFEDAKTTTGLLKKQSATTWAGDAGAWYWAANVLYYKPSSGAAADHTIYRWNTYYSINTNHANGYYNISNLIAKGAATAAIQCAFSNTNVRKCEALESYQGIYINGADNCIIGGSLDYKNKVYNNWGPGGIYNVNGSDNTTISYNEVYNNGNQNLNVHDRNGIGVGGVNPGNNVTIEHNLVYDNGPTNYSLVFDRAIEIYSSTGCIVRYNYIYNNYSGGIGITTNSNNSKIYSNILTGNGRNSDITTTTNLSDIFLASSTGLICVCNTTYGNVNNNNSDDNGSLCLNGGVGVGTDWIIKNNILSSPVNQPLIVLATGSYTGTNIDNNCYDKAGDQFKYGGALHSFADWKTNLGGDEHSIQNDPNFINASGLYNTPTDFYILNSSPCAFAGAYVSDIEYDYFGNNKIPIFSIGAYEVSGGSGGGLSPGLGLSGGNRPPWWNRRRR